MKIFLWIDSFFKTSRQRLVWLGFFSSWFWLWQCLCLFPLIWQVMQINDYDDLFALAGMLEDLNDTIISRIALQLMSASSLSAGRILQAFLSSVTAPEWALLFCGLLYFLGEKEKRVFWIPVLSGLLLIICLFWGISAGLSSSSIAQAIAVLQRFCGICVLLNGVNALFWTWTIIHNLMKSLSFFCDLRSTVYDS